MSWLWGVFTSVGKTVINTGQIYSFIQEKPNSNIKWPYCYWPNKQTKNAKIYKHMANSLWKQTLHVANLIKVLILAIPHCYHSVVISPWCSSVLGLSLWSGCYCMDYSWNNTATCCLDFSWRGEHSYMMYGFHLNLAFISD